MSVKCTRWQQSEIDYVKVNFPHMQTKHIAAHLNRSYRSVANRAHLMGLEKTAECKAATYADGIARLLEFSQGRFVKGQRPWNAGIPAKPHVLEALKSTMFKPGNIPKTAKHNGAVSLRLVDAETNRREYWVRVSLSKWRRLADLVWEKHNNATIPQGHFVRFTDNNPLNCAPENLFLANRSDNMSLNSLVRYPNEVRELIRAKNALKRKINQKIKEQ